MNELEYHSEEKPEPGPSGAAYGLVACLGATISIGCFVAIRCGTMPADIAPLALCAGVLGAGLAIVGIVLTMLQREAHRSSYLYLAVVLAGCVPLVLYLAFGVTAARVWEYFF